MRTDPDYRMNQIMSNKKWAEAHPDYWKEYRKKNPHKTARNRMLQTVRNQRRSNKGLIAKVDASNFTPRKMVGQFWLVPVIAKVDASKVNIYEIPIDYH
jgi:hypothetical protein